MPSLIILVVLLGVTLPFVSKNFFGLKNKYVDFSNMFFLQKILIINKTKLRTIYINK